MRRFGSLLLGILVALPALGQEAAGERLTVSPEALEMQVGETASIEVVVRDADGSPVSDPTVLFIPRRGQFWNLEQRTWGFNLFTVSGDGEVTASKPGEYSVLVRVPEADGDGFVEREVSLTIRVPEVSTVRFVSPPARYYAGTVLRLNVELSDPTGANRADVRPRYSSSDPSVATVDAAGQLRLLRAGSAAIAATAGDGAAELRFDVAPNPATSLVLEADATDVSTGDVVHLIARVVDEAGDVVGDAPVTYSFNARTDPMAVGGPSSGMIESDGRFVADLPGEYTVIATSGPHSDQRVITVTPRDVQREIELVGHGRVADRGTSDLWVWEGNDGRDYAITGTHSAEGHAYIWDVTEPSNLVMVDTVRVDARTVNDVKVSEDGSVAVISREGASNRRNGIVLLDVSSPSEGVRVVSSYDDELTGGVHNVFVYEDHVYALSAGQRYDIINIEDPANPHRVGRFQLPNADRSIHDVWVRDGIAYSANWNDGVVLVDVGGGGLGGSPRNPVMMGEFPFPTGWNHAVYPYRSASTGKFYIFAGDEAARTGRFSPIPERGSGTPGYEGESPRWRGWIHVLEWEPGGEGEPRLVGRYAVPEAGSHNIWIEDDVMYVAFYNGGLRVVDVSGELMGDLYRQGREIAHFLPFDPKGFMPNSPQVWGAQPFKGSIFFSDYNSGLWAVRLKGVAPGE